MPFQLHISKASQLVWAFSFGALGVLLASGATLAQASDFQVPAQFRASHATTLSAGMEGMIQSITVEEGDAFEKGETLVTFDCRVERAQTRRAEATLKAAMQQAEVAVRLTELKSASTLQGDLAEAKAEELQADLDVMRARLSRCAIKAPYSGRVIARHAEPFEQVSVADKILDVLDADSLEVEAIVPSVWLRWIEAGSGFSFEVNELAQTYEGQVARVGAVVDPVSRTVRVLGQLNNTDRSNLRPGMGGTLYLLGPVAEQNP